jgi:hypothetical protein
MNIIILGGKRPEENNSKYFVEDGWVSSSDTKRKVFLIADSRESINEAISSRDEFIKYFPKESDPKSFIMGAGEDISFRLQLPLGKITKGDIVKEISKAGLIVGQSIKPEMLDKVADVWHNTAKELKDAGKISTSPECIIFPYTMFVEFLGIPGEGEDRDVWKKDVEEIFKSLTPEKVRYHEALTL